MDTKASSDDARTAAENKAAPAFTPGPWDIDRGMWPILGVRPVETGFLLATLDANNWTYSTYRHNAEANARLIVAAPDLYAALKGFMESPVWRSVCDELACGCNTSQLFHAGDAALAKAEGRRSEAEEQEARASDGGTR